MKSEHPLDFCLLIPCYNNYDGLIESLKTIVYSSGRYLIVVVDDGSVQKLDEKDILRSVGFALPLTVISMDKNSGITRALNFGLDWIERNMACKYVARLDCGDKCDENRFLIQVELMNKQQDLVLTGSWCRFEDKDGNGYTYQTPTTHVAILREMHFRNVFIHPTVMYRLSAVKEVNNYPEGFDYAEDYALFWSLLSHGKSMVINKILVISEISKTGISFVNKGKQLVARWKVVKRYGSSWWLKGMGFIRLSLLFIIPKTLLLLLKEGKG